MHRDPARAASSSLKEKTALARRKQLRSRLRSETGAAPCAMLDRSRFGLLGRLRRIELAVALFDAAGPLVPGERDADWLARTPSHAAAISCCVRPFARARI